MGKDFTKELHKASVLFASATDLESRLSSALSLSSPAWDQSSLLQEALATITQLRTSSYQVIQGLIERKITMLSRLVMETDLAVDYQECISAHIVAWHKAVSEKKAIEVLGEGCGELDEDLLRLVQAMKEGKERAEGELRKKQRELIEKRKKEVDYAGIIKLATEDAVAGGGVVLAKLAAMEGRCKLLESKQQEAEINLARIQRLSTSRRPTEPARPFASLFPESSPRTPVIPHHKHSRSISHRPAFLPPLSIAMEHLDAMNEQVEALTILLCGDKQSHQAESLQTCVVSHRFRTLLSGFERWREVIA